MAGQQTLGSQVPEVHINKQRGTLHRPVGGREDNERLGVLLVVNRKSSDLLLELLVSFWYSTTVQMDVQRARLQWLMEPV